MKEPGRRYPHRQTYRVGQEVRWENFVQLWGRMLLGKVVWP